jgi:hypothetical protein
MRARRSGARGRGVASIVLGAAVLLCFAGASPAEQKMPTEEGAKKLVANRQQIVRNALALDPQQQVAFEPVYTAYEGERIALGRERNGIAEDFIKADAGMSASDAGALLDRSFRLRRQRIELDERFRPRFEAVLPPQKVLLLFQLNFVLDAVVNYDLAGMIELAH